MIYGVVMGQDGGCWGTDSTIGNLEKTHYFFILQAIPSECISRPPTYY